VAPPKCRRPVRNFAAWVWHSLRTHRRGHQDEIRIIQRRLQAPNEADRTGSMNPGRRSSCRN
jgi:hypothetical protein